MSVLGVVFYHFLPILTLFCLAVICLLTRALMGYFRTLHADGGGRFGPSGYLPNYGPILDPKTAFDCPGLELSEYVTKYYLKINDVTGRVKGRIFYYPSSLVLPGKAAVPD